MRERSRPVVKEGAQESWWPAVLFSSRLAILVYDLLFVFRHPHDRFTRNAGYPSDLGYLRMCQASVISPHLTSQS